MANDDSSDPFAGSRPPQQPLSGASLGLATDADASHESGTHRLELDSFGIPAGERYLEGGLLGRGGMGEIRAAFDQRLGRTVALKVPQTLDARTERRFVDEARITARLEHPGIIAIHDAGRTPDGQPFYTMPVMRGRSLADALTGADDQARLRLMRHFLDACQAVAYAHSEGMVHRDLKPANILVGRFGETAVVDWGLAGPIGEPASSHGGAVGTPPYMAPEQARGAPLTAAADVYALGMSLRELVTGNPLEILVDPSAGNGKTPRRPHREQPRELLAIAERATRADPAERYPNARALADELENWFEGRRVEAHTYSLSELAARAWTSYRAPLIAGGLALLGIALAVAVGYWRTALEHGRAVQAARAADEARASSDRHLAIAEVAQALEAMQRNQWTEAELLASSALVFGESPYARGVLARFDSPNRPRLIGRLNLPSCEMTAVAEWGQKVACLNEEVVRVYDPAQPDRPPLQFATAANQLSLPGAGDVLLADRPGTGVVAFGGQFGSSPTGRIIEKVTNIFLSASSSGAESGWLAGHNEHWGRLDTAAVDITQICTVQAKSIPVVSRVRADGARVAVCQNGQVWTHRWGQVPEFGGAVPAELGIPLNMALSVDGSKRMAIGLAKGGVTVLDLATGQVVRTLAQDLGTPFDLALTDRRLAISDGREGVFVWEVSSATLVTRLSARGARVRWVESDRRLRVVGSEVEDWELPTTAPYPHLHKSPSGIAAVAFAPDGQSVATAHGDGKVRIRRLDRQEPQLEVPLHWSVVKDVEFSPDSRTVAAICAQDFQLSLIRLEEPVQVTTLPIPASRRVAWLRTGLILLAPYRGGLIGWRGWPDGFPTLSRGGVRFQDLEADPDRSSLILRDMNFEISRLKDDPALEPERITTRLNSNGVAASPAGVAILERSALELRTPGGKVLRERLEGVVTTDITLSPEGALVAVGRLDGTVTLYDATDLSRLAVLRGHTGRISSMKFDPSGDWLATGSWDGDLRIWSMRSLKVPAETLLEEARRAWGRSLEDILDRRLLGPE